jgi:hypothetical protein
MSVLSTEGENQVTVVRELPVSKERDQTDPMRGWPQVASETIYRKTATK